MINITFRYCFFVRGSSVVNTLLPIIPYGALTSLICLLFAYELLTLS